nr:MAG TPA: protein of unknown function (DUF5320) [Caudoviricetes sp.]
MVKKEKMHTICRKLVKPSWGKSARDVDEMHRETAAFIYQIWAQYKTEIKALKREIRELKQKLEDDVE